MGGKMEIFAKYEKGWKEEGFQKGVWNKTFPNVDMDECRRFGDGKGLVSG